jgi:hypothetical protein
VAEAALVHLILIRVKVTTTLVGEVAKDVAEAVGVEMVLDLAL